MVNNNKLYECDYKGCKAKMHNYEVFHLVILGHLYTFCEPHYDKKAALIAKQIPKIDRFK